jgi:aspartate/methionine/tyrosine aminotransferase
LGRLKFDVADLRHLAAETGKFEMMLINFPHNPTGACLTTAELHDVLEVAREHDAWVFSDEMYRGLGTIRLRGFHRMRICSESMPACS